MGKELCEELKAHHFTMEVLFYERITKFMS